MSWSWDHLRFFLALAEEGTLSMAGRRLGVSHTTVLRRVRALERDLATRLFDRTRQGYVPSAAGEALRAEALRVRATVDAVAREIGGADERIGGEVVVTTTDTLASTVLPRLLAELGERHPALRFTLNLENALDDIDARAADIAIRACREPPERLIGRRVGAVRFVACAAPAYVAAHDLERFPERTGAHRFVVLDAAHAARPFQRWLEARLEPASARTTVNGLLAAVAACRAGLGIAVLPRYLLDEVPGLVALAVDAEIDSSELWLLSHADLRDTASVRVVRRHLYERLAPLFD